MVSPQIFRIFCWNFPYTLWQDLALFHRSHLLSFRIVFRNLCKYSNYLLVCFVYALLWVLSITQYRFVCIYTSLNWQWGSMRLKLNKVAESASVSSLFWSARISISPIHYVKTAIYFIATGRKMHRCIKMMAIIVSTEGLTGK